MVKIKKLIKKKPKKVKNDEKSKSKYATMSVDEFLSKDFDEDSDKNDSEPSDIEDLEAELEKEVESDVENDKEDNEDDDEDEEPNVDFEKHMKSLEKLKESDPEFYKFLKENDEKLLKFSASDDEDYEEQDKLHKPEGNLEIASDESDYEDENVTQSIDDNVITLKLLKKWQIDIKNDKTNQTLSNLGEALHAALLRVSPVENEIPKFKVDGSSIFNGVIQLCVLEFGPAVRRYLGLTTGSKITPHKCKKFNKVKKILKYYFEDLLKLLIGVASSNIQTVLLKHLHYMSSLLISFQSSVKSIIKQLIKFWGTSDEGVRVIAFFCILRITRQDPANLLDMVLKSMYLTYVKNSKFVSVSSLASINFMRRSLVEMYALDLNVSYQHVFLYIRQLGIHLRNAIISNKKENTQTVYNWQYVNSLKLWGNLLSVTSNKQELQQLIYPFVQVCLGTLKLVPTVQYYPLRFHILQILMDLSKDVDVFIPIIPFLTDVLINFDFNKKHLKVSMKPLHFTCILRVSKSQMGENGFKDTLIDVIHSQILEYMSQQSHSIAYPELSFIAKTQIKQFIKNCKNANYTRKFKQIVEKLEQNSDFIDNERKKLTINLNDFKRINGWEIQIKNKGTPLTIYYDNWSKFRNQKKKKELTNNEELGDYNLPILKKRKIDDVVDKKKNDGPVELFPSDSEDDDDTDNLNAKKKLRGKRGARKIKDHSGPIIDDGTQDIVKDIDLNDW